MCAPRRILSLIVLLAAAALAPGAPVDAQTGDSPGADRPYLDELVARADALSIARSREWRVLLHDHRNLLGGFTSEVDGPAFFYAANGKHDPRAELDATLARFFDPPTGDPEVEHPQCRFPARYRFLKGRLAFDPQRLPEQPCPRLDRWLAGLNTTRVVMVFPSAYLNNPASMYGHTFLRLDNPDRPDLLDYSVNYAAIVGEDAGLLYALRGVFGMYEGQFGLWPYYVKVQEYGELENRDIWEYTLNLTSPQVARLLAHLWELKDTYFDYYFFKENCSYALLGLLEAADPALNLTDRYHVYTIPTDTLRQLMAQPGLVEKVTYRPARSSVIRYRRSILPDREARMALDVAWGRLAADPPPAGITPDTWATVLELADDYLLYKEAEQTEEGRLSTADQAIKSEILRARSRTGAPAPELVVPTPLVAPHEGHGPGRMQFGGGRRFGEVYSAVQFRAAYHDLLDPDAGYEPYSRLIFFDVEGRRYHTTGRTELNRLTLFDVFSLYPWDAFFRKPSWRLHAGWQSLDDRNCPHCGAFNLNLGFGRAFGTAVLGRELLYLFLDGDADYGPQLRHDGAVGGGVEAGILLDPLPSWKVALSARYTGYVLGDRFESRRAGARTTVTLARNLALGGGLERVEVRGGPRYEGHGALNVYF